MFIKLTFFLAFVLLSFLSMAQHSYDWGYSPTDLLARGGEVVGEANVQDSDGNVYIVGNFNNTANFDPSSDTKYLTSVGSEDGYIVKYDSLGNLIWVNAIAGSGDNYIYDVTLDSSNNIFITGSFELEADFDPSSNQEIRTATGGFDAYVAKYDSSGGFLWVNVMGGADGSSLTEAGNALAIDQMQDVYVIGRFSNSVDFDPSAATNNLTSIGTDDVFLAKYGNNGNYYWANSFDATQGNGIAIDTANNVCITGAYNVTADFDPGPGTANLTVVLGIDIYLAKYDSNGNYIWAKGLDARAGRDLVIDNSNDIYLLATNQSANSDLDPSAGTALFSQAGGRDVLLAKYNENGDYLWADQVVSGSGFEDAYAIVLSKNQDQVYITGEFEGTTSVGGPSLSSNGGTDIFIASFYTNTGNVSASPKKIGGTGNDTGNDILISSTEKISITGSFESIVDFNPDAGINDLYAAGALKNAFNAQYTGDGVISHVFANSIGELGNLSSTSQEEGQFVQTDAAGNVYVAGSYEGKIDFGLDSNVYSPLEVDGNAIFIAKLDPNGNLLWANAVIGNSSQILFDLALDAAGNVYIVGAITGDTDFDAMGGGALTTFNGGADAFLAKYDSNGNYLWSNSIGGSDSETARTAVVNSLGNVVITGTFQSTIDINPSGTPNFIGSVTGNDAFMAEYDGSGVLQWGNVFAGNLIARSMTIDTSDNIFISGDFANTSVDFDPSAGVASFTSTEAYIAKYDAGGNFLWVNPLEGGVYDIGDLEINDNKLFVLGNFNGTMDSDPSIATNTLTSNGSSRDVFLIRFDLDGNHEWAVSFGGTGHETATGIGFYGNNEIYLAGGFYGTTDLDPSAATANYTASFGNSGSDIYISSLDSTGNFLWALSPSKSSSVQLRHLSTDNSGNVFVTGSFSNLGFDVDPSANSSYIFAQNSLDAHVIKYRRPCVTVSSTYTVSACGSYTWIDGNTYSTNNNTATHTVVTPGACDTLYTLDLTINVANTGTDVITACDTYTWIDGNTYTSSNNTATFTLTNAAGCDSVVTLDLTINNSTTGTDIITACDSYTWIDGNTYTSSNNTATVTLTNAVGCDSVVTLNLTINNSSTGTDVITACDSYTWIDGNTYTSSNNAAIFTLTNAVGCDSIVTLDLTINNSTTGTDVITACDSYTWIDGNTYTSSNNTATFTLTNAAGCDSLVTLDLIINNSTTATDVVTSCNNYYTWINGVTYIANNTTATHTITNAAGCDSIITLDLTFLTAATGIDVQVACGIFTWIDGNTYASSTNTPTYTIVGGGANGCDSIVSLDLTIINSNTGVDVQTACDSYTWIDGNTYTSSNNIATHTLTNIAGCDSVVTLDLTINPIPNNTVTETGALLEADQAGATYQWLDCDDNYSIINAATNQAFTPEVTGNYAVEITMNGCADTSSCYLVDFTGISELEAQVISIHPNPTSSLLFISGLDQVSGVQRMEILSVTGEVVSRMEGHNEQIDVSKLPNGVYILKILHETRVESIRFVKQ